MVLRRRAAVIAFTALLAAGCGGSAESSSPHRADGVLPAALNEEVAGALERVSAHCDVQQTGYGYGQVEPSGIPAGDAYPTLEYIATELPRAIYESEYGGRPTMVELLEDFDSDSSCGLERDLAELGSALRTQHP